MAGGVNLYAYAGNNPASFSDPFGLASCPEEAGGDGKTERYDDCPKFSPGWFANRSATGQGNEVLNTIGGVLSILGRHLSVSGTAGNGTASVDAVGLAGGVPAGSLEGTENYPAASLPQLGASVNVTLGDVDDVGDQLNIGLGHHAGLTVNFSAKTGNANGLVFNIGVATPQIPVTASRNTDDQLRLVPRIAPELPGVTVKLP